MVRHETTLFNNRPERIKHFILNSRNYITNFIQQYIYIYIWVQLIDTLKVFANKSFEKKKTLILNTTFMNNIKKGQKIQLIFSFPIKCF